MNDSDSIRQLVTRSTGIVSLAEYGAVLDGSTDCLAAVNAMISQLGSRNVTLLVPGPCSVSGNVTIPSNVKVRFEANGSFIGAGVVTFTRWDLYCVAEYNTTAGQAVSPSGSFVVVNYGTKVKDSDGAVTTGAGTWHFTVPAGKDGDYSISAAATFNTSPGTDPALHIFKNGVRTAVLFDMTASAAFGAVTTAVGTAVLTGLVAGDQIDVRAAQNSGGSVNLSASALVNRITIYRISR